MAQGREGQAGSRHRSLPLRDMGPLFCPGQVNALRSIRRSKHLHPSTVQPHTWCSILCFLLDTRMSRLWRREVGCMHLSPPWHSRTKPDALPCPSSPSPHNRASYTMEMGTTAWSKTPQRGCVPGFGHAADVDAADLGRHIPRAASVALQARGGFHRPGEACVGVLLAGERIPPICLSLVLSPAPVKVRLSAPWAGSQGSFCLLLCNLYVRDLAVCLGSCSPAPLEALGSVQAPASCTHWSKGIFPRCHGDAE